MEMIFDDFEAQLQCEDIQAEYIPTDEDLEEMGMVFIFNPEILEMDFDFDLDSPF
jgi:hypothetical protein